MKLIILRGLPGTGKTTLAEKLVEKIGAVNIWTDGFKHEAKTGSRLKDCNYAYKKTLKILEEYNAKNIKYAIVTEILYSRNFRNNLLKFIKKSKSKAYWFQLKRPLSALLENEAKRKRKIKNTRKDFLEMRKKINNCKIRQEIVINNIEINSAFREIFQKIK